jgi:hypothetical protein
VQRDIEPNEIDWVFCWRTIIGEVRPGARDGAWNGKRVPYQPRGGRPEESGLRTIVRGRVRTCPRPPIGPRLDGQGSISRMCGFLCGHVTHGSVVPARNMRELRALRDAARAALVAGDASVWALAAIRARGRVRWAIHLGAPSAVVSELAERVDAPWRLDLHEKLVGSWVKGSQIFCRDREGRVTHTLEADAVFDEAPLPAFFSTWRPLIREREIVNTERGGAIDVPYTRPAGRGAWGKWVKE